MKTTVYNVKTGESAKVEGVDAREYVATGGWSLEPPGDVGEEGAAQDFQTQKRIDPQEVDVEVVTKTTGRKTKKAGK